MLYRFFLALGDVLALLLSFTAAYILRVSLSSQPIQIDINSTTFITSVITLLPLWIGLFYLLGLYSHRVYDYRTRELPRLLVAAGLGIMIMISFAFFTNTPLFPAKLVAVYAFGISFVLLATIRALIRTMKLISLDRGRGLARLLITGDSDATTSLVNFIDANRRSGYQIVGIVSHDRYVPPTMKHTHFAHIEQAIEQTKPDIIMQTDNDKNGRIYDQAVNNHIAYQFVPTHEALISTKHATEIIGTLPVIMVQTTPLIGYGRVVKRVVDIVGSITALTITTPIWLLAMCIMKITEPKSPVLFLQQRLSRHHKPVFIYKFRTLKKVYNGLTPEEAFEKMGKPELAAEYRLGGDQLEHDPRLTVFGRFMRTTSIDEIPQFINVLKGDISLVGPRALVPSELKKYPQKHLILSVKSGLSGLAQVSGRRDISFEDRRALDIYYVNNWSLWLDIQIIFKTLYFVIVRRGAR